ncbi:hypothetical protein FRC15_011312 [Serendipita sp. 397]|nr:hypothetical protein FRC15_011312 [Serendipita sp. 397]
MSSLPRRLVWEPDPAIQLLSDLTSRPIERLDYDVLLHTFRIYLEMNRSIVNLLLTCSRWHNIVESQPSLRSNIHFWPAGHLSSIKKAVSKSRHDSLYSHDVGVACTTPTQLRRAIERLNGAPFTISFHGYIAIKDYPKNEWDCISWPAFSERCTGIHILNGTVELPILESLPVMRKISVLSDIKSTGKNVPVILYKIPKGIPSPLLQVYINAPGDLDPILFPKIIARIKTLEIAGDVPVSFSQEQCQRLLSSFRDLEHLTWRGNRHDADNLREAVSCGFKLKSLTVTGLMSSPFPFSVLESLVELTMDVQCVPPIGDYISLTTGGDSDNSNVVITLPVLTHLALIGSWIDLLRIDAPLLQKLILNPGKYQETPIRLLYLTHTRLRPSTVHIVDQSGDVILEIFLRGTFDSISELKIHVPAWWVKSGRLERFLAVPKGRKESMIVPNLRHLVVSVFSSTLSDKEAVEKATNAATRWRIEDGLLWSVRCLGEEIDL